MLDSIYRVNWFKMRMTCTLALCKIYCVKVTDIDEYLITICPILFMMIDYSIQLLESSGK